MAGGSSLCWWWRGGRRGGAGSCDGPARAQPRRRRWAARPGCRFRRRTRCGRWISRTTTTVSGVTGTGGGVTGTAVDGVGGSGMGRASPVPPARVVCKPGHDAQERRRADPRRHDATHHGRMTFPFPRGRALRHRSVVPLPAVAPVPMRIAVLGLVLGLGRECGLGLGLDAHADGSGRRWIGQVLLWRLPGGRRRYDDDVIDDHVAGDDDRRHGGGRRRRGQGDHCPHWRRRRAVGGGAVRVRPRQCGVGQASRAGHAVRRPSLLRAPSRRCIDLLQSVVGCWDTTDPTGSVWSTREMPRPCVSGEDARTATGT